MMHLPPGTDTKQGHLQLDGRFSTFDGTNQCVRDSRVDPVLFDFALQNTLTQTPIPTTVFFEAYMDMWSLW